MSILFSYRGKLASFGEQVLAAVSPGQHNRGNVRFVKMVWITKRERSDMHVCLSSEGAYLTSSVRRLSQDAWTGELFERLQGSPWQYGFGQLGNRLVPGMRSRQAATEPAYLPDGFAVRERRGSESLAEQHTLKTAV